MAHYLIELTESGCDHWNVVQYVQTEEDKIKDLMRTILEEMLDIYFENEFGPSFSARGPNDLKKEEIYDVKKSEIVSSGNGFKRDYLRRKKAR